MSTRPEPQVGQTWVSDPGDPSAGQIIRITKVVDGGGYYPIGIRWPTGMDGSRTSDMEGFSPTAETLEKWNQAGAAPRAELAAAKATIARLKSIARARVNHWRQSFDAAPCLSVSVHWHEAEWFLTLIESADAAPAVVAESTDYSI